ncbi:hypothetical protein G6514_001819 [Epicoccum nigrum]|nr:hypothetical protein G6514_001819 [Epicoccum nigrum]
MAPATSSKRRTCLKLPHFGNSTKTYKRTKKETVADTGEFATELESAFTERNQRLSPLLRLPGEIRNRIYFYAVGNGPLPIPSGHTSPNLFGLHTLSKVCRQLHAETRLLPYALNDLCFVTIPSFVAWSRRAPEEVRAVVRCIMFEYVSRPQSLPKYASAFLSLKKVKTKPGRPKGRQKLEAVMSKNGIGWEIVEEEEPWGRQLGRVVAPPLIFMSAPVVAAPAAISIEESIDTLAEMMQKSWQIK